MNLYISVLFGSGCSQSFLGTVRESILRLSEKLCCKGLEKKLVQNKRRREDSSVGYPNIWSSSLAVADNAGEIVLGPG